MQKIASGVGLATSLVQAPGQSNRLYITDLFGAIRILDLTTNTVLPTPFLTILDTKNAGEGGILGLAFHPDFANNGKFYVNVTVDNGGIPIGEGFVSPFSTHIREYTVAPGSNVANSSYRDLLTIVQPQDVHNGGWLTFGPNDGYLYAMLGDGGGGYDSMPGHDPLIGNAQDLTNNLLGKALRIDVNGDDFPNDPNRNYAIPPTNPFVGVEGDDEIWAYGLRNPWQASFDRETGDLWIGDVGEATREEVNFQPANSAGGANYGWRLREGTGIPEFVGGERPAGNVEPVYDYVHFGQPGDNAFKGNSVTGGFVYRGPDPEVWGKYVFADFVSNQFWTFDPANPYGTVTNVTSMLQSPEGPVTAVTTFGQDVDGNLYVANVFGDVFRMITDETISADFNGDGIVNSQDLPFWKTGFGKTGSVDRHDGDANLNGLVGGIDFLIWQRQLGIAAAENVPEPTSLAISLGIVAMLAGARRSSRA